MDSSNLLRRILSGNSPVGTEDKHSRRIVHLPWTYVHGDGLIEMQHPEPPWLYWSLPTAPMAWTDEEDRLATGNQLVSLLSELGHTSPLPMGNRPALANNREIHILTITIDAPPQLPPDATVEQAELLRNVFDNLGNYLVPTRICFIGVKMLPPTIIQQLSEGELGLRKESLREITKTILGISSSVRELYQDDIDVIKSILSKHRCHVLNNQEMDMLLSWYNRGRGNGVRMHSHPSYIEIIDSNDRLEFATIRQFERPIQRGTTYTWASEAVSHYSGAIAISVRGELEPAAVTINRMRNVSRKQRSVLKEMSTTEDLSDDSQVSQFSLQREVEAYLRASNEPVLINTSIVLARYAHKTQETYIDMLHNQFDIRARPLWHRQISALQECLPGPTVRLNRHEQPMNLNGLAFSGIGSFGEIGDSEGIYIGRSDPDLTLSWLDPTRARAGSAKDQSPGVAVLGDAGSGKLQPCNAIIPTPTGTTLMGDLHIGDQVFDRRGAVCTVRYVSPTNPMPDLYELTLSDGQTIRADWNHQWIVFSKNNQPTTAPATHWQAQQEEIAAIQHLAHTYTDDQSLTATQLLTLLHQHNLIPQWETTRYLQTALDFVDCPYNYTRDHDDQSQNTNNTAKTYPAAIALKSIALRLSQQVGPKSTDELFERVLTTGDMLNEGIYNNATPSQSRFSIQATKPLQLPKAYLPIEPRLLGAWLRNNPDDTHLTLFKEKAPSEHPVYIDTLKKLGIATHKRIPMAYLRASFEQRFAMLKGLLGADQPTHSGDSAYYVLVLSEEDLARDVASLIRSLGIVGSCKQLKDERGQVLGQRGELWQVAFETSLPVSNAFRTGLSSEGTITSDSLDIIDIRPIASVPGRCIQVDSADGSYLCADFVPTHNTFFMQWMALQSAWMGRTVFYINPKPQDDLSPLVRLAGQKCKAELINLGDAAQDPGSFDPFRFAHPAFIHEIASQFIIDVLGKDWDDRTQTRLMASLQRAVLSKQARCMGEAIQFIDDVTTRETILELAESNSMFALAFSKVPRPRMDAGNGLTLIQFDQILPDTDDEKNLSIPDRVLLAVMRLIPRVSLEVLLRADGGDLYVDEAHRLLSSRAGRSFIERQGREGRSQGIMSVLGTHKPSEIVKSGVSEFMGRVFALKLKNAEEAAIALDLIGFNPTDASRIDLMRSAIAPIAPNHTTHTPAKPAQAFHRDIDQRKGLISIYPIPEWVRLELSTSTEDRMLRKNQPPDSVSSKIPTNSIAL